MPELPEVETIVRGLRKQVVNKKITKLVCLRAGTIINHTPVPLPRLRLGHVQSVERRGKYILVETTNNYSIVIHLRMTGKLVFANQKDKLPSHTRAYFALSDQSILYFQDIRTFGKIEIQKSKECNAAVAKLGIEPLTSAFNANYLRKITKNRTAPIKNLLLNQNLIAGIGNIYACEALHRSRIDPCLPAKDLRHEQASTLVQEIKKILRLAIKYNGTSISDYRRIDDKIGEFQNLLRVYQQKRCPCGHQIKRIKQAGRSTYYCPACQHSSL